MKVALYIFFTISIVLTVIGLGIILMDRASENVNIQAVGCYLRRHRLCCAKFAF